MLRQISQLLLCTQFLEFGLKITAEVNHHVVNFLDVTFNLREESYRPYAYRKPNNDPLYINRNSNHPPSITKQILASSSISSLSSNKSAFDSITDTYETALHRSNVTIMSNLSILLKLPRRTYLV